MDVVEKLKAASENGEIVQIVYHGGSQPGTVRDIAPIKVTSKEVRARCYKSGSVKTFKVEKIEVLPNNDTSASPYVPNYLERHDDVSSIRDLVEQNLKELEHLGWYVKIHEKSISIHRYFKNGRPRKGADVGIVYNVESISRPWYVFGPDLATARTYAHLNKAMTLFIDQARIHAPERTEK